VLDEVSVQGLDLSVERNGEHLDLDPGCLKVPHAMALNARVRVESPDPHLCNAVLDQPFGARGLSSTSGSTWFERRVHRRADGLAPTSKMLLKGNILAMFTAFIAVSLSDDVPFLDNHHADAWTGVGSAGFLYGLARLLEREPHEREVVGGQLRGRRSDDVRLHQTFNQQQPIGSQWRTLILKVDDFVDTHVKKYKLTKEQTKNVMMKVALIAKPIAGDGK
jgi:hypothetical protein